MSTGMLEYRPSPAPVCVELATISDCPLSCGIESSKGLVRGGGVVLAVIRERRVLLVVVVWAGVVAGRLFCSVVELVCRVVVGVRLGESSCLVKVKCEG